MKNLATLAAFAAGTNGFVSRSNSCCFHITASGETSGTVGQLGDGQNRIGGGLPQAEFCISSNGSITDGSGRGCIVTGPTTQFQCDLGATPMTGFSINSGGQLEFEGSPEFVACETGDNNELNIYTTESSDVTNCDDVKLNVDSCSAISSGSSSVPAIPSSPAPHPSTSVPGFVPSSSSSTPPAPGPESTSASCCAPTQTVFVTVTSTFCGAETGSAVPPPVPGVPTTPGTSSVPGFPVPGPSQPTTSGAPQPQPSETTSGTTSTQTSMTTSPPQSSGTTTSIHTSVTTSPPQPPGTTSQPQSSQTPTSPQSTESSTVQPSGTPTQSPGASCPTDLSGEFEFPHLIVPVDSASPGIAAGTSFNGTVTSTVSTIFNFDIPASDSGKTCSLVFLFPNKAELETSSFSFSGDGKVKFESLESAADTSTTFNSAPAVKQDFGEFTISPGNSYLISSFACPAGQAVGYEMTNAGTTHLDFFEDFNPAPIGLFITVC